MIKPVLQKATMPGPPPWYGQGQGIFHPLTTSHPRSQLMVSTEEMGKKEREAISNLADHVRLVFYFQTCVLQTSFFSREEVMQYRIKPMLDILAADGAPSFGKGLLHFCFDR